jgi:hypothetical protein
MILILKGLKEMLLMKLMKLKKVMGLLLRYLLHFGEVQRNFILRKFHQEKK